MAIQANYRGARGSNAGDDYHELWALRQALPLLDHEGELRAVGVEGLRLEDEAGTPTDTWDGVDCSLYFEGDSAPSATRIVLQQFKYSGASPTKPWTIARLTQNTTKKRQTSVIAKLARAFTGLRAKRPDLVANRQLFVKLVSNQPADSHVFAALSEPQSGTRSRSNPSKASRDHSALRAATGMKRDEFEIFAKALDLSECGGESRFALEERVLASISAWTEDDARTTVNDLLDLVRRKMLPEGKGEVITRESILVRMGFSDPGALFPCPSAIRRLDHLVPRQESQAVTTRMLSGEQFLCLHGDAGCGKTTALQEIESLLPAGSVVITFDCYGGGTYLNSDAYRHRPRDAFLQLSNDLAVRLRVPLLLSLSTNADYPRAFKKRVERAAEVVAAQAGGALLVIVIDAADNSITAASNCSPAKKSFVQDFAALGGLPVNVRLLVTTRTGRLHSLKLPPKFVVTPLTGFSRAETASHVRVFWADPPESWLDDFHHFSGGNPRVQRYALQYAGSVVARAIECLLPNGKDLDQIFQSHLDHARLKGGISDDIKSFCAGLIALPRPIPITDLAAVTNLSLAETIDLCGDLAPGVRTDRGLIAFADEDFEHFVRDEAAEGIDLIRGRIADHFNVRHTTDAYAATHVAAALLAAGRGADILPLVSAVPTAIKDPVVRRQTQLQRLRLAMKVCRETGNRVEALMTLLVGAEAVKTDAAIRQTIIGNPDLAARFVQDSARRIVLRDPAELENHGSLLFQLLAADSRKGDPIAVREGMRQLAAWLQRRKQEGEDKERRFPGSVPQPWRIEISDIAAETEATLRIWGSRPAASQLRRWRPKSIAIHAATLLCCRLITSGDERLIRQCLDDKAVPAPFDLLLLTPLALGQQGIDVTRIERDLICLLRRNLLPLDELRNFGNKTDTLQTFFDTVFTASELAIARQRSVGALMPLLEHFGDRKWRLCDRLFASRARMIDLTLRAHALIERLSGRRISIDSYLVEPGVSDQDSSSPEGERNKKWNREHRDELSGLISPLIQIYDLRAAIILGVVSADNVDALFDGATERLLRDDYRFSRFPESSGLRGRAALAIAELIGVPNVDRVKLVGRAKEILSPQTISFAPDEARVLETFALDRSLHNQILDTISPKIGAIRTAKAAAEEKIESLIRLARLLVPISAEDAESVFRLAIEVAGECDADAIHEVALLAPISERAIPAIGQSERRQIAANVATIISDTSIRLAGYDNFPWEAAANTLATIDTAFALAAVGRWEDSGIIGRSTFLPTVLQNALSHREISAGEAVALLSLLDFAGSDFIRQIVNSARRDGNLDRGALAEELAKEELLRFGGGRRPEIAQELFSMSDRVSGYWLNQLRRTRDFHGTYGSIPVEVPHPLGSAVSHLEDPSELLTNTIERTKYRFDSVHEIEEVFHKIRDARRESKTWVPTSWILEQMAEHVPVGGRVRHLEALVACADRELMSDYELARAITLRLNAWSGSPSVDHWRRERAPEVVKDLLPAFCRWLDRDDAQLPQLLQISGLSDEDTCELLLEAAERHVDSLDAPTLYALVGLTGGYATPADARDVLCRWSSRLVGRIPAQDRESWFLDDIPIETSKSLARLLFALMGDVDVRIRWRAPSCRPSPRAPRRH